MNKINTTLTNLGMQYVQQEARKLGVTPDIAVAFIFDRLAQTMDADDVLAACPHCPAVSGPHDSNCPARTPDVERRLIPGFFAYDVAGDGSGEIRSLKYDPPQALARRVSKTSPYPFVSLSRGGKQHTMAIHRAVCLAFHGPPPFSGAVVSHEPDPNPQNVHPDNLRWASKRRNGEMRRFRARAAKQSQ